MVPQKGIRAKQCFAVSSKGIYHFIKADKYSLCYRSNFPGKIRMTAKHKTVSKSLSSGVIATDLYPMFEACAIPHLPFMR